ncbi:MAG: ABC transporter ATP-binding protein [Pyrobaculum sp.]
MYVKFDVYKRLGDFALRASGEVREGVTCVVGPNGSGKTTLLKILAGLLKPDRGQVEESGVFSKVYVGEFYAPPEATGLDVVLAGRTRFSGKPVGRLDEEIARRYAELLEAEAFLSRRWHTLSGGQRQRLVIAAALAAEADLLLLDEPLSNLHGDWREKVMEVLQRYAEGRAVVLSTHHGDVLSCCHWVIELQDGAVRWAGPASSHRGGLREARCLKKGQP